MTVEEFKALRVGQLVKTGTGFWKIIEKIGHTIICTALINQTKAAFSVHDAEGLTLDFAGGWPKRFKASIHSDQFIMLSHGERLGLSGEALGLFKHALCRVEFEIEVQDDGKFRILTVDGHEVKE